MREPHLHRLALAIDPTSRGFAFAVLERPGRLVDWGTKYAARENRNARCVTVVGSLMRAYTPDVLVLEDCGASGSRRCDRVRTLIRELHGLAASRRVAVRLISPHLLREVCTGLPRATKHDVARLLASQFPELARHVPPRRKTWMSEDARINVFDAVGLAIAALDGRAATESRQHPARGRP